MHSSLVVPRILFFIILVITIIIPIASAADKYTLDPLWGSTLTGNSALNNASGIAIDSRGDIYVADSSKQRIQVLNHDGRLIATWESPDGSGSPYYPREISVDASDKVYVFERGLRSEVLTYDTGGNVIFRWDGSGREGADRWAMWGMATDANGNIFAYGNGDGIFQIRKYSSSGQLLTRWGSLGEGDGQFKEGPGTLGVDRSGNVYVGDTFYSYTGAKGIGTTRIQKFNPDGKFLSKWGEYGNEAGDAGNKDGQLSYPKAIAIDDAGFVYVGDQSPQKVQKFDPSGRFITRINKDGELDSVGAIAVDHQGNVYIIDSGKGRVFKYIPAGLSPNVANVTVSCDPMVVFLGKSTDVNGYVYDAQKKGLQGKQVVMKISRDNGTTWESGFFLSESDSSGHFVSSWTPKEQREYRVKASADGIESKEFKVTVVEPRKTDVAKVTLSSDPAEFFLGETTFVSGNVYNATGAGIAGKSVVMKASRDDGVTWENWPFFYLTDNSGHFISPWSPLEQRIFRVKAVVEGVESEEIIIKIRELPACWNTLNPDDSLPSGLKTFDWKDRNGKTYMTPVKNQNYNGPCWVFNSVGAMEAVYNIMRNQSINPDLDLAEQELVSCYKSGSGYPDQSLEWIKDHNIVDETCFPYSSAQEQCHICNDALTRSYTITGYHKVIGSNGNPPTTEEIKKALYCRGPLATGVEEPPIISHAFVIVGWDDNINGGSWIWRNSFGVDDPNTKEGYEYIQYDCNPKLKCPLPDYCSNEAKYASMCNIQSWTYWVEGVRKI